ncbi:MAG: polysaccharide deacetylase family protein [Fuerstiella sp.]
MNRCATSTPHSGSVNDFSSHRQIVEDVDRRELERQIEQSTDENRWQDPSNFWNPGPATFRENAKLRLLHGIAVASGSLRPVFGRLATSTFGILTYHRVSEKTSKSRDRRVVQPSINVSPKQFRNQLLGLQQKGFQFRRLSDLMQDISQQCDGRLSEGSLCERTIVVTFDDIYDNVFHNAWPILQELNIPATVFISTAFLDSPEPFPFDHWARKFYGDVSQEDWRPIQSSHLEQMLSSHLIELGAHTHTHQDFRTRPSDFSADLADGIQQLKQRFSVDRLPFAFPYGVPRLGFANQQLMDHVRKTDLTCGLTTGGHANLFGSDPYGWGRFHVFEHDSAASLSAKLDGYYEWLPALKNRVTSLLRT